MLVGVDSAGILKAGGQFVVQRKAGKSGDSPRSRGSSLAGHRSLRSSAGASLALPAWLRFLGGVSLDLLADASFGLRVEE